jgi:hypothetical protein
MASVQELIDAANAQKSPGISAMEGLARGYLGGQQQALERAKTLIMLEQNRREQEQRMEHQKQMRAEMALAREQGLKQSKNEAGVKQDGVTTQQKLNEITSFETDESGNVSRKTTYSTPKEDDNLGVFQKVEYLDDKGKTRIGSYDRRTGRVLKGIDDPDAPVSRNSESDPIKRAKDLRKEFSQQSKEFFGVNDSMARIRSSAKDPSAAGDLALIFNYMKVLDPGSVVRETEFATAQNAAGVPDRIRAKYNQVLSGERLSPDTRADFVDRAEMLFEGQRSIHSTREKEYRRLAESVGADPDQVIFSPLIDSRESVKSSSQGDSPSGKKAAGRWNPKTGKVEKF